VTRLRLLPGERELVRLRPSLQFWVPRYLLASGFALWGLALPWIWSTGWHSNLVESTVGLFVAVVFIPPSGPVLVALALYAAHQRWLRFALVVAGAIAASVTLALVALPDSTAAVLPVWFALSAVALLLTEIDRRMSHYHLTNLRMVYLGGLWSHASWTAHYESILDVDIRRNLLARILGYATLEPILSHAQELAPPTKRRKMAVRALENTGLIPPMLVGVGRWRVVARLVQAFIQDATSSDYLRAEQQTQRKVGDALRALGRSNVLPPRR
jgi:hypothetical protein